MRRHILAFGLIIVAVLLTAAQCSLLDPGIPSPDPDPTPGATLFFDDFDDGFDPTWSVTSGWGLIDGMILNATNGWKYAYVETGSDWDDYMVEVEIDPRGEGAAVILRCQQDLQDYILVGGTHDEIWWKVFVDAEVISESGDIKPGLFDGMQEVKIEVRGYTYRLYVNGIKRLDFTDTHFTKGMPGFAAWGYLIDEVSSRFDNFRVTALK